MNNSRHTSLTRTMAQMRHRYNARSGGGNAAPRTPYTPAVVLTLTGPDTVTRGDTATYTASITPSGLSPDTTLTFEWKYTATVRIDRDPVCITESIDATSQNPQTTTWSGTMVAGGTVEVSATVNDKKYASPPLDVTVNNRAWVTDAPICTDTTSLGTEAPQQHSDLGEAEYDILYTPADKLDIAKVGSGPNDGMFYLASLNLTAPFIVKINRHFRMAEADLPPTWVAFKNANTRYDEIETKLKARLGFDGTTSRTLYGSWKIEIGYNDPKARLEEFMEVPGDYLSDYKSQIMTYLDYIRTSRKAGMKRSISGWRPSGITINYNYFAAHAGSDQTVSVGSTVNFDGSGSVVPQGREFIYTWTFGDGSTGTEETTADGVQATHPYSTTGAKDVTLTVTERGSDICYCDTMTVTVMQSLKRHHSIPVGMMAIEHEELFGLKDYFEKIYTGESDDTISRYQACNHLHSYGYNFDNLGTRDTNDSTKDYWGLNNSTANREQRNAQAWANYVKTVAEANNAVGNGNLKCLISRALMGLYRHTERTYPNWSLSELRSYVHDTIHKIDAIDPSIHPNPRSLVAGWYLNDDGLPRNIHGKEEWEDVVCEVHAAQKQCGVNWPFYWADNIDGNEFWNPAGTDVSIPQKLKDWVTAFPSDATPVFMPYYYPWPGNWEYSVHPPWKKWRVFMERLHEAFFITAATATHPNLKFHPILEAAKDTYTTKEVNKAKEDAKKTETTVTITVGQDTDLVPPGHADMHKQIRVVWELLRTYSSVTGIWVLGWNKAADGSRANAEENWTENRRYAEAFQNELYEREGIQDAIPDANKLLLNSPVNFEQKIRIPYSLRDRRSFNIRIYDKPISEIGAKLIRTINDGYYEASPQGKYVNSPNDPSAYQQLAGTSAHWDGMYWDTTDGNKYKLADDGDYYVYLFFINTSVDGPIIIRKE